MKSLAAISAALLALNAAAATVVYDLTLWLKVPRVYNNTASLGHRAYQLQKIVGTLYVETDCETTPALSIPCMENKTHKVAGSNVTYRATVGAYPVWAVIGNNRTGRFKTASVRFDVDAEPSYNVGAPDEPDNTLVLTLSGRGTDRWIHGNVAGQIGCGCRAYGHKSPTRIMFTDTVTDIAAVHGTWTARRRN